MFTTAAVDYYAGGNLRHAPPPSLLAIALGVPSFVLWKLDKFSAFSVAFKDETMRLLHTIRADSGSRQQQQPRPAPRGDGKLGTKGSEYNRYYCANSSNNTSKESSHCRTAVKCFRVKLRSY